MSDCENQIVTDLFGNERYLKPRAKGRPPFEWTEENSRKVSMLLAMGWRNERIAGCILDPRTGKPISVPTLKRYFRSELKLRDMARDMLFAKRLLEANEAAEAGNVGAMRFREQLIEKNDRALADARLGDRPKETKSPPIGKKQLSEKEARSAEERLREEANRARTH